MDTYEIPPEPLRITNTWKHNAIAALIFGVIFFLLRFGWSAIAPTETEKVRGFLSTAIQAGVVSLIYGIGMGFLPRWWPKGVPVIVGGKLLVDEDSITGVTEYGGFLKGRSTRRTVHSGKIRSVFEIKGPRKGVGISERSEFGARMLGFVYLPETLPEYVELKKLAQSWRVTESSN